MTASRAARVRCGWAVGDLLGPYHDREWGVPQHDDRRLFELITLEGAQAGLSWLTVLRRRQGYRRAFHDFDPVAVAAFSPADVERCLADPGIVRHRQKVESTVTNARAVLALQAQAGSLDRWLWARVEGRPLQPDRPPGSPPPAQTPLSRRLSRELVGLGFRFVGPTICYALMQAAGLVNDHDPSCYRRHALGG